MTNHTANGVLARIESAWTGKSNGQEQKATMAATGTPIVDAFRPFPTELLPDPIGNYVRMGAASIGCCPSFVALPMLAGLAAAIGNSTRLAIKNNWHVPAILWTCIVGESGTAKSPALELALRPLRKRQHAAMQEHDKAMREHEAAMADFDRKMTDWKKSNDGTTAPTRPDAPTPERCWCDDTTVEALAALLHQNPRGLLVARDELAGWAASFDKYSGGRGGADVARWLEMYDGRPLLVDRRGGATLYIPRAAVSLAGGIQPGVLARMLSAENRENGLAARLLMSCPPRSVKKWTDTDVDELTTSAVDRAFGRLFARPFDTDADGDPRPALLTFSEDARAEYIRFFKKHALDQMDLTGDDAAAAAKLEGGCARLALILHLADWACRGDGHPPGCVDHLAVARAVELTGWFAHESRRVYALLSEPEDARRLRELSEWIARRGGVVASRDVAKGLRAYRNNQTGADRDLQRLADQGIGTYQYDRKAGTPGPARRVFTLNPPFGKSEILGGDSASKFGLGDSANAELDGAGSAVTSTEMPQEPPEPGYWSDGSPIIVPPDLGDHDGGYQP